MVAKKKYSKKRVGWVKKLDLISHTIELEQNNTKMIELFLDRESMLYAVHDFIKTTKNSRAFAIQNNRAWRMWTEVLSEDIVNNLHDTFAKNKIILDMVISDEFEFELLKNSYSERPSSINIVPEKYLQTDLDIEMNGKYLLIMNWRKQKGIKINDPDIVRFFTGILKYIKDTAPMLNIHK
ncbi:MAG: hypothetical protein UZ19_OD1000557 [Parcubacteria bacterium OLB19]|nr:MAG: hypothetical protein UZ19_OD1000557 [Parcubacteria bacterium OLB19]